MPDIVKVLVHYIADGILIADDMHKTFGHIAVGFDFGGVPKPTARVTLVRYGLFGAGGYAVVVYKASPVAVSTYIRKVHNFFPAIYKRVKLMFKFFNSNDMSLYLEVIRVEFFF